jgi:hypothetical protein
MYKICAHCFYEVQNTKNNIFSNIGHPTISDLLGQMSELRAFLNSHSVHIATHSLINPCDADAFFFIDSPCLSSDLFRYAIQSCKPIFIYLWESPIIDQRKEALYSIPNIAHFFSTSYLPIDPKRYTYCNYTVSAEDICNFADSPEIPFVMISGNKYSSASQELYSLRRTVANWFGSHHADEFHIYGSGWDFSPHSLTRFRAYTLASKILPSLTRLSRTSRCFKGFANDKMNILANSLYSFCFENAENSCGYVSEKILHCLQAGCIPIYKGYTGISSLVPRGLYILYDDFPDMQSLYDYCIGRSLENRSAYLATLRSFLDSPQFGKFTHHAFASKVGSALISHSQLT